MTTPLFDRALLVQRQQRAAWLATEPDFLAREVVDDIAMRLSAVQRSFATVAVFGSAASSLAQQLLARDGAERVVRVNPYPTPVISGGVRPEPGSGDLCSLIADDEVCPFAPDSLDLAVSLLSLHHVNDLPGALIQLRRSLRPDGLLLAAMFGGDTLTELRQAFAIAEAEIDGGVSPRVAPFADVRQLGALLQRAGFALPVTDRDRLTVRYTDVVELMRDLRVMAATNVLHERRRTPMSRQLLMRLGEVYGERFSDGDGRIRATFEIVTLTGWAPHESQQQPLRPGSAKARLADALGTIERPAGERAGND